MTIGTDPRPSETQMRRTREVHDILLPAIREIGRQRGYAITVHGSLERDIDLVAVPWAEHATAATSLVEHIYRACDAILGVTGPCGWTTKEKFAPPPGSLPNPAKKPHGRLAWTIHFGFGAAYIDLSVMPRVEPAPAPPVAVAKPRKRAGK